MAIYLYRSSMMYLLLSAALLARALLKKPFLMSVTVLPWKIKKTSKSLFQKVHKRHVKHVSQIMVYKFINNSLNMATHFWAITRNHFLVGVHLLVRHWLYLAVWEGDGSCAAHPPLKPQLLFTAPPARTQTSNVTVLHPCDVAQTFLQLRKNTPSRLCKISMVTQYCFYVSHVEFHKPSANKINNK